MKDCKCDYGKYLGILLVPKTPFENGMSISDWNDKREINAKNIIENLKTNIENSNAIFIKNEKSNPTNKSNP